MISQRDESSRRDLFRIVEGWGHPVLLGDEVEDNQPDFQEDESSGFEET